MFRVQLGYLAARPTKKAEIVVDARHCEPSLNMPLLRPPRVRFAPSPTGHLHIGGLRTALFNYLFAQKTASPTIGGDSNVKGEMILRIEDTDQNRSVPGAVENLVKMLQWAGVEINEGPFATHQPHTPYFQSERLDIYKDYAHELIDRGKAYHCFCSQERLAQHRRLQLKSGLGSSHYDRRCHRLPHSEVTARLNGGESHTIRMCIPPGSTTVQDLVLGRVKFRHSSIDDQILMKADGFPTYHLANVVDDHLMDITHVIRGEEWLPSTPKHLLLYEWLEWDPPAFVHLPLLLNTSRAKLSKRHGDVSVTDFMNKGYLPEALCNFVALLGWNPGSGDTQEIYTMDELICKFSLDHINTGGAVVDIKKLDFINREHIKRMCNGSASQQSILRDRAKPFFKQFVDSHSPLLADDAYVDKVLHLLQERAHTLEDYGRYGAYFFEPPIFEGNVDIKYEVQKGLNKEKWNSVVRPILAEQFALMSDDAFSARAINTTLKSICKSDAYGLKQRDVFKPLRLQVTGMKDGVSLPSILELLGRDVVLERLNVQVF